MLRAPRRPHVHPQQGRPQGVALTAASRARGRGDEVDLSTTVGGTSRRVSKGMAEVRGGKGGYAVFGHRRLHCVEGRAERKSDRSRLVGGRPRDIKLVSPGKEGNVSVKPPGPRTGCARMMACMGCSRMKKRPLASPPTMPGWSTSSFHRPGKTLLTPKRGGGEVYSMGEMYSISRMAVVV